MMVRPDRSLTLAVDVPDPCVPIVALCAALGLPKPVYYTEAGDGSFASASGLRVWMTIDETRYEVPKPKSLEAGKKNLAIRVLKHLEKEEAAKAEAAAAK